MNKKGFTLVELLAVIAILAILVIIALPNILEMYRTARKNIFLNEVQSIYDSSRKKYMLNQFKGSSEEEIYTNTDSSKKLDLQGGTGGDGFKYCVIVDANGNITNIKVTNGTYKYESSSITDNANSSLVNEVGENYTFVCEGDPSATIKYIYTDSSSRISIGSALPNGLAYSLNIESMTNGVFMKHKLVDDIVTQSEMVVHRNGNYYYLNTSAGNYETNKQIILGFFDSSECEIESTVTTCEADNMIARVNDGSIIITTNGWSNGCLADNTRSYCEYN